MRDGDNIRVRNIPIPGPSAWGERCLKVLSYGTPGARPKAYFQASLHADEIPGMLVIQHLRQLLNDARESIKGEIVLVPVANPLGLAQVISGHLVGRYALNGAGNYNRHFPDLAPAVKGRVAERLGRDADNNIALIRAALRAELDDEIPVEETAWLRHCLLGLAVDADYVLDLHCDLEAWLHCYFGTPLWPDAADLSAQLGSRASLLATQSGGRPFDEAVAGPWWALADQFPQTPIPPACLSCTIELRGTLDVDDGQAHRDALNLFKFLQRRGVIEGDPGPLPAALCEATGLDAVDVVQAPAGGVLSYVSPLGSLVQEDECVARIVDPLKVSSPQERVELKARTQGIMFARTNSRFVEPGQVICKIAGAKPLLYRREGQLLVD